MHLDLHARDEKHFERKNVFDYERWVSLYFWNKNSERAVQNKLEGLEFETFVLSCSAEK
jgi:hypothetical protein